MSAMADVAPSIADLGEQLTRYRKSLPAPAKSKLRIRCRDNRVYLTLQKGSGLRLLVDANRASFAGAKLPRLAIEVQRFQTTTESSPNSTRLVISPKNTGAIGKKPRQSVKGEFSE